MVLPSREEFLALCSDGKKTPIIRDLLADFETPLSAYWKLAHDEVFSFLLESVTGGENLARYSILGVRPRLTLRTKGDKVRRITAKGESRATLEPGQDPLHLLDAEIAPIRESEHLPRFFGGAVAMLGYDVVRFFERLPEKTQDDLATDDMAAMLVDTVVVFDHAKNLIRIVACADPVPEAYDAALAEIERIVDRLRRPLPPVPNQRLDASPVESNFQREDFEKAVETARQYILAGDGTQFVLSQRFTSHTAASPLSVYRALRSLNPSPYMFLLRLGDYDVVGASPEILVSLHGDEASVRPIAGTRPRGETAAEDERLAEELLADEKERAEHIMLVDLGRNDLGRTCTPGTVEVTDLMSVERYSHVMHIVSSVTGRLMAGRTGFDLVRACFPAGTVSGAPKVRAMEIIEELEPTRRGLYAGAVGWFGGTGSLDLSIAIRTILMENGRAHVQAGAGIVADSVPASEYQETVNKAKACLRAIEMAQNGTAS